jgi:hypothetical protein
MPILIRVEDEPLNTEERENLGNVKIKMNFNKESDEKQVHVSAIFEDIFIQSNNSELPAKDDEEDEAFHHEPILCTHPLIESS